MRYKYFLAYRHRYSPYYPMILKLILSFSIQEEEVLWHSFFDALRSFVSYHAFNSRSTACAHSYSSDLDPASKRLVFRVLIEYSFIACWET